MGSADRLASYDREYVDDPVGVPGDEVLWRRIPSQWIVRDDNQGGRFKLSSAAFDDPPGGTAMSSHVARLRGTEKEALARHSGYRLARYTADFARRHQQGIALTPDEGDPTDPKDRDSHVSVFGPKSRSTRRKFARESDVYEPDGEAWVPAGEPLRPPPTSDDSSD